MLCPPPMLLTARSNVIYTLSAAERGAMNGANLLLLIMNNLLTIRSVRAVETVYLHHAIERLSLSGRLLRLLVTQGNLLKEGTDNVRETFDYFEVNAARGIGGNEGIDRYYLTGKDAGGGSISIDAVFDRSEAAIRLNFNNLSDGEVEQWMANLDRVLGL
jgi:hypothetical protein